MIKELNSESNSVTVEVYDDSGLPVEGLDASTFPDVFYRRAAASTGQLALSTLATESAPWSDGGVKESAEGGGKYRLDLSNFLFTSAGDVTIWGEASGKHMLPVLLEVRASVLFDGELENGLSGLASEVAALITPLTFTKSPTSFTPPNFDVSLKQGVDYVSATGRLTSFVIGGIPDPTAVRWEFKHGRTVTNTITAAFTAAGSGWLISAPLTRTQLADIANGQYDHVFIAEHAGGYEQEIANGKAVVYG